MAGKRPKQDWGVADRGGGKDCWKKSFLLDKDFRGERARQNRVAFQTLQKVDMSLEVDFPEYFLACNISIISRQIVLNLILEPLQY